MSVAIAEPRRILVFRIGQLGDTVVGLPAMWAIRERFPRAHIALLYDQHAGRPYVLAVDLLAGAGLFDEFIVYPFQQAGLGRILGARRTLRLLLRLRAARFDALAYLAPSVRTPRQVARDRRFFKAAGIARILGMTGFPVLPPKQPGRPLAAVPHEADLLLARLSAAGIPVVHPGEGRMDLGLGPEEDVQVARWGSGLGSDGTRPWIGVGPGSKMPVKVWPEARFASVVGELIDRYDVWPVVFGGPEDREKGERLTGVWGRGYNAAGALSLRAAAAAMMRCRIYLGNDTGPMHLAAAAGTPCIVVFSSREWAGMWFPYGEGHRVFRTDVDCEGCQLLECIERRMECVMRIEAEAVLAACCEVLERRVAEQERAQRP